MLTDIITDILKIPNWFWQWIAWLVATAISGWIGYRWGLRSKDRSDIKDAKLKLIPVLDQAIEKAAHDPSPNIVLRESIAKLKETYLRFRIHLTGRKLRKFNEAWTRLQQTTEAEMIEGSNNGVFLPETEAAFRIAAGILTSRLEAFRKSAHDA